MYHTSDRGSRPAADCATSTGAQRHHCVKSGEHLLGALAQHNIALVRNHPFVQRCAAGRIDMPALRLFLAQHGIYGQYFTRYLCALIANLRSSDDVMRLAQNLAEELGFDGGVQGEPHARIYARMLSDFGIDLAHEPVLPGTRTLIDTMFRLCRDQNPVHGLAALCMGAEAIVPALYGDIMKGFAGCGVDSSRLEFFRIHIECDDKHAETMHDILLRLLESDTSQIMLAQASARSSIQARLAFLSNLDWEAS